MKNTTIARRRRGIKASRLKLTAARQAAGFKTQAAIAERIADTEALDSPPKDAVNRAFRELPVEHETLTRIALALGVDAESLLPDEVPANAPADLPTQPAPPTRPGAPWVMAAVALAALSVGLLAGYLKRQPDNNATPDQRYAVSEFASLAGGRSSLHILPIENDADGTLLSSLREGLATEFSIASATALALSGDDGGRLQTDAQLDVQVQTVGRWIGLAVFLQAGDVRRQVYATSMTSAAYQRRDERLATTIVSAVLAAIGRQGIEPGPFPLLAAQTDYLHGQRHLDQPANELNIRRAQSRFQSALRNDSGYARAHAGLCRALLEEYWMDDEQRALRDAALPCTQALQLAPDDPIVATARARYLQVTGRNDEAMAKYELLLAQHPDNADALLGLAISKLHAFQASGDSEVLDEGRRLARRAGAVDAFVWKPFYYLGTMELMANNADGGVAAIEAGLARDENEFLLVNLGSYRTCVGQFEQAKQAYERAQEISPGTYVGDEFMGQLHYFLGEFEQAALLRQRAVDSFPGGDPSVHEMWGNLADSLRHVGNHSNAIAAYRKAAEIAEQDVMSGNGRASDSAARAYYYTALNDLAPGVIPPAIMTGIVSELDKIADEQVDPAGFRLMAMTYARRDERNKARESLKKATTRCPGYTRHPDLRQLASNDVSVDEG